MNISTRDGLGRLVRDAWIRWAKQQPNPKASWLAPYDELSEPDKEADRQIGETVFEYATSRPRAVLGSQPDVHFFRCEDCGLDICISGVRSPSLAEKILEAEGWIILAGGWHCQECVPEQVSSLMVDAIYNS